MKHLVKCEECDGKGMKQYSPVYVNGDLYQDGEILECEECDGRGTVTEESDEDYDPYELFQLKRYGYIIPNRENTPDDEQYENGILELNRLADFIESQSETNLLNYSL